MGLFRNALSVEPDNPVALYGMAYALEKQGELMKGYQQIEGQKQTQLKAVKYYARLYDLRSAPHEIRSQANGKRQMLEYELREIGGM